LIQFVRFAHGSIAIVLRGRRGYWAWLGLLLLVIATGVAAYGNQLANGLIVSNMRDPLSWGFYIGNFAFLVGVAAAAVVLVIPAYVYHWGPIREVVLLGEITAISAIIMCMLFVMVDVGRPDRLWHLFPGIGNPNFPSSILVWDILVLNAYFAVNFFVVTYLVFKSYMGQPYRPEFVYPIVFLSIPLAIGIHTVTAFLFMGLKSRPFWNTAILAPRFLSSAFCSGPALLIIIFRVLRAVSPIPISNAALRKIGELLGYAMAVNLFFLGCEVFKEFYSASAHTIHAEFQWFGLKGDGIAAYTWFALVCNTAAFLIFGVSSLRNRINVLTAGCVLAVAGVFIEKGLGLLLPGLTPDMLGEVYRYAPSLNEVLVAAGVWGIGALCFTLMVKVAMAITAGEFRYQQR
jgi:molybdopterin-containing oxidoreductase family membrane subunit